MAMEELELTEAQAQALLDSPSPLADVYRYFEKLETGYMDVIRDSIENRADDVCRAQEELRNSRLYPHFSCLCERTWGAGAVPSFQQCQIANARRPLKRRCGNTSTECISVTMPPRV